MDFRNNPAVRPGQLTNIRPSAPRRLTRPANSLLREMDLGRSATRSTANEHGSPARVGRDHPRYQRISGTGPRSPKAPAVGILLRVKPSGQR